MKNDKYELTPCGLLGLELVGATKGTLTTEDATLFLHSLKRYAFSRKQNAIIFTKKGNIIFGKVRKAK